MKTIKLNLGAGRDHKSGWINADIDPRTNPDKIIDLSAPLPFTDNSIDEVLLQDVLEHFIKQDAQKIIAEISRVLKPGGKFSLRVPDTKQIQRQFESDQEVMIEFLYGTTDGNGIWGAHKYGYTKDSLEKLLKKNLFTQVVIQNETTNLIASCLKSNSKAVNPNILVIEQAPDWGGAEEWMTTLVSGWRKRGYVVTGATNLDKMQQAWKSKGVKVENIPFILDIIGNYKGLVKSLLLLPYAIYWYTRLLKAQKRTGINCIVMSGFSEKMLVTFLAKIIGIPIIWFEYGPLKKVFAKNAYLPKVVYRAVKDIPEVVCTISQITKMSLIQDAKVSLSKIEVVSPGVTVLESTPKLPKNIVIGHLSRLTPEKGQRVLLEAFRLFLVKYPESRLKIAGSGPDEAHLKELAKNLKIADRVDFLGFVKDKQKFYESVSLFVFTSIWELEGFGMVMAEAMGQGRSVIAVDNGPAREVIGESGGIVVDKSPESVRDGIEKMIHKNLIEQSKMANKYAKNHYRDTIQVAKISKIIQDVVNYSSQ